MVRHRPQDQRRRALSTRSRLRSTRPQEPTGSNGIAIAGANTASGKAMLLINPHTSFFFREEAQMVSEEGLNAYGALTWGQFFIYQGFNDKAGWMHTSSSVDNIDEYLETVTKKADGSYTYRVGTEERPLDREEDRRAVQVGHRHGSRSEFTTYRTHRGPIVRQADGKWVSVRLMEEPMKALIQSFSRTKARNLAEYKKVMEAHTNSSNNTLYADADGNIAYLHSNFIPKRDPKFDWTKPVDGSNPATEWNGVLSFDESPNVVNPKNGWVYNTNNYPFSAAGPGNSPRQKAFPAYVDSGSENPRGVHAIKVLTGKKGLTLDTLITDVAYDSYQPEFEIQIPLLLKAHAAAPASNPLKAKTADAIAVLKDWDYRWSATSVPQSVAMFYGEDLWTRVQPEARKANVSVYEYMKSKATAAAAPRIAGRRDRQAHRRFRQVADAVGRHQPLPAQRRRDRAEVRRQQAEHAGDVPVGALGIAGVVRRARVSRHQEVVRHQRQQLRGGGRVRRPGEGEGGDRRRPEQRARLEALQRSGRALRDRQPARRLFLSRRAQGPHRARIQAGAIGSDDWRLRPERPARSTSRSRRRRATSRPRDRTSGGCRSTSSFTAISTRPRRAR